MKSHMQDLEQDENDVIAVVRKWDFLKRKLSVVAKKLSKQIGRKEMSRKIVNLKLWLDEAEHFLKYHSREERSSQEIQKINVRLYAMIS